MAAAAIISLLGTLLMTQTEAGASTAGIQCVQIWQYQVTETGTITDAESGGNTIGTAVPGQLFNVRIKGFPRYFGWDAGNNTWGWILSSKLFYNGQTWCG